MSTGRRIGDTKLRNTPEMRAASLRELFALEQARFTTTVPRELDRAAQIRYLEDARGLKGHVKGSMQKRSTSDKAVAKSVTAVGAAMEHPQRRAAIAITTMHSLQEELGGRASGSRLLDRRIYTPLGHIASFIDAHGLIEDTDGTAYNPFA